LRFGKLFALGLHGYLFIIFLLLLLYGSLAFTTLTLFGCGSGSGSGRSCFNFLCLLLCVFLLGLYATVAAAIFGGLLSGLLSALLVIVSDLGGGDVVRGEEVCKGGMTVALLSVNVCMNYNAPIRALTVRGLHGHLDLDVLTCSLSAVLLRRAWKIKTRIFGNVEKGQQR